MVDDKRSGDPWRDALDVSPDGPTQKVPRVPDGRAGRADRADPLLPAPTLFVDPPSDVEARSASDPGHSDVFRPAPTELLASDGGKGASARGAPRPISLPPKDAEVALAEATYDDLPEGAGVPGARRVDEGGAAPEPLAEVDRPPTRGFAAPAVTDVVKMFRANEVTSEERRPEEAPPPVAPARHQQPTELLRPIRDDVEPPGVPREDPFSGVVRTELDVGLGPPSSVPPPPALEPPAPPAAPQDEAASFDAPSPDAPDAPDAPPPAVPPQILAAQEAMIPPPPSAYGEIQPARPRPRSPAVVLLLALVSVVVGVALMTIGLWAAGLVDPREKIAAILDAQAGDLDPLDDGAPGTAPPAEQAPPKAPDEGTAAADAVAVASDDDGADDADDGARGGDGAAGDEGAAGDDAAPAAADPTGAEAAGAVPTTEAEEKAQASAATAKGAKRARKASDRVDVDVAIVKSVDKSRSGVQGLSRALAVGVRDGLKPTVRIARRANRGDLGVSLVLKDLDVKSSASETVVEARCDALVTVGARRRVTSSLQATASVGVEGRLSRDDKRTLTREAVSRCAGELADQIVDEARALRAGGARRR